MFARRYTVVFTGLPDECFIGNTLIDTWECAADEVYRRTGTYVSATLFTSYFICGHNRGCDLGGLSAQYTVVWNPTEVEEEEVFHEAFIDVVENVKTIFKNPYMGITIDEIDFYYFIGA